MRGQDRLTWTAELECCFRLGVFKRQTRRIIELSLSHTREYTHDSRNFDS